MSSIFEGTMTLNNWKEIEKYSKEGAKVLFPLGVIEEHGPHISLGSDINWSHAISLRVREKLRELGSESVVAPPYYWGVNHCTGGFPGSFSLRPETMQQVLFEIFENLKNFGFLEVYCFNYHGDSLHVKSIVESIKRANAELGLCVKLVLEAMDLGLYGWTGNEDFLLVYKPDYPLEWFEEIEPDEQGLFDIHAGAYETAVMNYFCPEQVDINVALSLKSSSLDNDGMKKWLQGGDVTKEVVPLGYAGNPAGYRMVEKHVKEMIDLQVQDIVGQIVRKN